MECKTGDKVWVYKTGLRPTEGLVQYIHPELPLLVKVSSYDTFVLVDYLYARPGDKDRLVKNLREDAERLNEYADEI